MEAGKICGMIQDQIGTAYSTLDHKIIRGVFIRQSGGRKSKDRNEEVKREDTHSKDEAIPFIEQAEEYKIKHYPKAIYDLHYEKSPPHLMAPRPQTGEKVEPRIFTKIKRLRKRHSEGNKNDNFANENRGNDYKCYEEKNDD